MQMLTIMEMLLCHQEGVKTSDLICLEFIFCSLDFSLDLIPLSLNLLH